LKYVQIKKKEFYLVCARMIICLGPICFPVWHLIPVLLLLFAKAKDWFLAIFGAKKEAVVAGKDNEVTEEEGTSIDGKLGDSELRHRKKGGEVIVVGSRDHWNKLLKV
jgi:hypothetical protein